jgi:integrase
MTTAVAIAAAREVGLIELNAYDRTPTLSHTEQAALASVCGHRFQMVFAAEEIALRRLLAPIVDVLRMVGIPDPTGARRVMLRKMSRWQTAFWAWDEPVWRSILGSSGRNFQESVTNESGVRIQLLVLAYQLCGLRRLHRRVGMVRLPQLADLVFGHGAALPAVDEVNTTLVSWRTSAHTIEWQVTNATLDLLITCGSPRLEDVQEAQLVQLVAEYPPGTGRRNGLFKVSRVLAHKGIISAPLTSNHRHRGPFQETLDSAPGEWLEWALRWRRISTHEPSTVRGMFSTILVAGRWAAEKHPDRIGPDKWTRDMAAEYVGDTMTATMGQWAGVNRNRTRWGQPLSAVGKAQRMDTLRSFFGDLIEWEWIHAGFDPKSVLSLPLSIRAQMGPNPRIIDDVAWAKLMAAGLALDAEDLNGYGTPAARQVGHRDTYYPIAMVRALVGVWLFGGCRIDEIRRLEVDCVIWDEGTDEKTGKRYPICLLRVPQNKTSGPFNKPVDPLVGQVIDAWKLVRPSQPLLEDRKTHERREYLFCFRGQLVGSAYLNNQIIPALCRKAGMPDTDSRGALTSHRARATIATQLLNADEPLTLADLQQ